MSTTVEIRCINKSESFDPHERILNVGGLTEGGRPWKLSQTDAIHYIVKDTCLFYVKRGSNEVNVVIASHSGWKYLKTTADGDQPDDLLSLPECP